MQRTKHNNDRQHINKYLYPVTNMLIDQLVTVRTVGHFNFWLSLSLSLSLSKTLSWTLKFRLRK